jgi:benzoyl-CoA reductase/2-hydroxyglutaryl-CoA dehydratase subunit BcrC/BadD/HgdB
MNTWMELVRELEAAAAHPRRTVLRVMKETGKQAVGCFPIYTPEEIVHAAGFLPVGMWGGPTQGRLADRYLQSFCCSVMRANTEQALRGDYDMLSAVILTTFCDTLKCVLENWKVAAPRLRLIPMVYPQNRKSEAGKVFLREEFLRVGDELASVAGRQISPEVLEASVDVYDDWREAMREFTATVARYPRTFDAKRRHAVLKAAFFMDKQAYTEKIRYITDGLRYLPAEAGKRKRVILSGLLCEPPAILDLLTENGLHVVADDLAQESRQFRTSAPREGDALHRMVTRIAMQDGCAFLYDEGKSRGRRLVGTARREKAAGVIFCQLKFCDPDEFDYPILKKELAAAGLPLLHIEIEQQTDSSEQLRTRIQSFAEMLEG